jgi:signal recognition particle subunit SRP54
MVGLQGSGKTTSTAKIARMLSEKQRQKVLMASLDVYRPAAQEQLRQLGEQNSVSPHCRSWRVKKPAKPLPSARWKPVALKDFDVVILDTAGRLAIDEEMMAEVALVRDTGKTG